MTGTKTLLPLALASVLALAGAIRPANAMPARDKAAYLGVVAVPVDDTLRDQLKLARGVGLAVDKVMPDTPAAKAGLKEHDLLEKLNDQVLFNAPQLAGLVRSLTPGDKVNVTLIRQGQRQTLEVTLGETELPDRPASLMAGALGAGGVWAQGFETRVDREIEKGLSVQAEPAGGGRPTAFLGVELLPVPDALATQLGVAEGKGALVNQVVGDSPAAKAGLKPHDVVTELDGKAVEGPADLSARIGQHKKGETVALRVLRAGKPVDIQATLAEKSVADPAHVEKLMQGYRAVPRVRVLRAAPEGDDVVLHFDPDGQPGRVERRVVVRTDDGGKAATVHVVPRPGASASSGTLEHKVVVVTTDQGLTTTVTDENGKRSVIVKNADNRVIFDGPVNTAEERQKLPPEARESLDKLDKQVETGLDTERKEVIRELRVAPAPATPDVI